MKFPTASASPTSSSTTGGPRQRPDRRRFPQKSTLAELRDRCFAAHEAFQEARTLDTARIHLNHLVETLGKSFDLSALDLSYLQKHVDRRCPKVSPSTAGKEISPFASTSRPANSRRHPRRSLNSAEW